MTLASTAVPEPAPESNADAASETAHRILWGERVGFRRELPPVQRGRRVRAFWVENASVFDANSPENEWHVGSGAGGER